MTKTWYVSVCTILYCVNIVIVCRKAFYFFTIFSFIAISCLFEYAFSLFFLVSLYNRCTSASFLHRFLFCRLFFRQHWKRKLCRHEGKKRWTHNTNPKCWKNRIEKTFYTRKKMIFFLFIVKELTKEEIQWNLAYDMEH